VEVGAGIWYVVKLIMLLVVVVVAVMTAIALPRRRKFAGMWRAVSSVVVALAAAVWAVVSPVGASVVWVASGFLVGAAVGFATGRLAKPSMRRGEPSVRRWALAQILWSLGAVLLAVALLFGTPMLAAMALIWVVLAIAMVAGSEVGELTVAPRAVPGPVYAPQPVYPPAYPQPVYPPAYPQPYPQPQPPAYPPAQPPQA
jgi:hypothetical protein